MRQFIFVAILFLCSYVTAELKFGVVYPGATSASVVIGGTAYPLSTVPGWTNVPYFNGSVASAVFQPNLTYHYIVDGAEETFERIFPGSGGRTKSYNDFFMRQNTVQEITPMGWPLSHWTRNSGSDGVFEEDYFTTIIFTDTWANQFFMNVSMKTQIKNGISVAMIFKSDEAYFTDCGLNIEDTSQLRPNMKIETTKNYKKRSDFKLRPSVSDPVFIRDKLYNDILESVGCPHSESSFARVYINGAGLGIYNLQEKVGSKDFVKAQFYGKVTNPDPIGIPLDAGTGADFATDTDIYAFQPPKNSSNAIISTLINALAALNPNDATQVANFEANWWSIEHFFRAMAVEYLAGHYDSYWFMSTNFVVYNDVTEGTTGGKFYFIDQDFDQTFGLNLSPIYNPYGANYTRIPYTVYVNANWSVVEYDAPHRTMVDKLIGTSPALKARFEEILKTIVIGTFNPIALNRRIDALAARVRPEIEWDISLGQNRAHLGNASVAFQWTIQDFDNGFTQSLAGNWGLKTFISERANFVAQQFGIQFQNPPLDPPVKNTTSSTTGSPVTVTTGLNSDSDSAGTKPVISFIALLFAILAYL